MLRKLIKYEILADWKKYGIVSAALILISIMLLIVDKMSALVVNSQFIVYISMILSIVFFALAAVAAAMLFVFATIRFYKGFIRDEGYLMHTLPVPTWQLIASNLIAVYIWVILLVAVLIICGGIAMGKPMWLFYFIDHRGELVDSLAVQFGSEATRYLIRIFGITAILTFISPALYMAHTYFSFALGNLFSRNKLAISVLMFFVISFVEQILLAIVSFPFLLKLMPIVDDASVEQSFKIAVDSSVLSIIFSVIVAIGYLIAAERIFAKKLNLE